MCAEYTECLHKVKVVAELIGKQNTNLLLFSWYIFIVYVSNILNNN